MKISKQSRIVSAILVGGIVVASSACSVDSLAPTSASKRLVPSTPSLASGASRSGQSMPDMSRDGTYSVTIDPLVVNVLPMGANKLEIPANAICAVGTSTYGPSYWNTSCALQTRPVQLTVVVNSTSGEGASVDFQPALRFSPSTNVQLTLSAPSVSQQDVKDWVILYCPSMTSTTSGKGSGGSGSGKDANKCVNQALTDKELQTYIDYDLRQLSRRIKHFSRYRAGYVVSE